MVNSKGHYISFEEFKNNCGMKAKTIKRNLEKIPGCVVTENGCVFLKGTRYPYNLRNTKLNDSQKRRFVLLKAISMYRFIDHRMLQCEEKDFIILLRQLICEGWIEKNDNINYYGANKYNATIAGERALSENAKRRLLEISEIAGTFTGAVISQVYNPG